MQNFFKQVGLFLAALAFLLGLVWVFAGNSYQLEKFFSPKIEQVRRETVEQSKSFRDAQIQELQNMQFEYIRADPAHQVALASIIRHRAATIPPGNIPSELYLFIKGLPQ